MELVEEMLGSNCSRTKKGKFDLVRQRGEKAFQAKATADGQRNKRPGYIWKIASSLTQFD